jgi:hypothetical protein
MVVNEHKTILNTTLRHIRVTKQLVVRNDIVVNEQKALSNVTRRHKLR